MENFISGSNVQSLLVLVAYVAYLAFIMIRGLQPRKPSLLNFVVIPVLMVYSVVQLYDGFGSGASIIELCIITVYAIGKGIFLGNRKIIQVNDGVATYSHDGGYIAIWTVLFAIKILFSVLFGMLTGATIPVWHTLMYFATYYISRTLTLIFREPKLLDALKRRKG